ncbi:MAG: CBS domain-containing protein, partial [Nitrospinota bacterium]
IMNKQIVSISEKETIRGCATTIVKEDSGSLLVVDENENLKGIVTENDIVRRAVANGMDLDSETVAKIVVPEKVGF